MRNRSSVVKSITEGLLPSCPVFKMYAETPFQGYMYMYIVYVHLYYVHFGATGVVPNLAGRDG